ncbi:hypothetical protein CTTA_4591 [Comamonas testosteroni]|uniref:Uncharacterized protein n=1 Tax=Comamonas testosteroni TaxID=285 RepID=A0A5A7MIL7_COMTE|nr:hypothetical protein CTTA_4591 [Comamonas testosteroni]
MADADGSPFVDEWPTDNSENCGPEVGERRYGACKNASGAAYFLDDEWRKNRGDECCHAHQGLNCGAGEQCFPWAGVTCYF